MLLAIVVMTLLAGCPTTSSVKLDPNGVYLGDVTLFQADQAVAGAADAFTAFVKWEHLNRAELAKVPAIRTLSASINDNSKQWINSYLAVRDAYVAAPSDNGKVSLTTAFTVLKAALAQAAAYMAQPVPSPIPVPAT